MTEAVSPQRMNPDDFSNDVKATLSSTDGFIPGFVVGVLWEPIRRLSIGGWYRFSDKISSSTDLRAEADFFQASGAVNPAPVVTEIEDAGRLELQIPMEARIGFRYRHPRSGNPRCQDFVEKHRGYVRDAYSQDLFDLELDLTWAHNSAVDQLTLTFNDRHQINGTPGTVPLDGSIIHNWKDVLGVRLGGEVIPVPDLLALRLGGFFESKGVDDEFLNIDFHVSERVGISGGGGRLRFGPVAIAVSYQPTFVFDLGNGGNGQVRGLSGDATTGDFRTRQAINGGNANSSLDEVGLAVSYHF